MYDVKFYRYGILNGPPVADHSSIKLTGTSIQGGTNVSENRPTIIGGHPQSHAAKSLKDSVRERVRKRSNRPPVGR